MTTMMAINYFDECDNFEVISTVRTSMAISMAGRQQLDANGGSGTYDRVRMSSGVAAN